MEKTGDDYYLSTAADKERLQWLHGLETHTAPLVGRSHVVPQQHTCQALNATYIVGRQNEKHAKRNLLCRSRAPPNLALSRHINLESMRSDRPNQKLALAAHKAYF